MGRGCIKVMTKGDASAVGASFVLFLKDKDAGLQHINPYAISTRGIGLIFISGIFKAMATCA